MQQHGLDQFVMADAAVPKGAEPLILRSQLANLALVSPWIERLASEHAIPDTTQFAMNLCLEEALSNIIRHGYGSKTDGLIVVRYAPVQESFFLLIIDDQAPRFDPVAAPATPIEDSLEGTRQGGLGIRLMRNFASTLKYEPTPDGNRLTLGFSTAPPASNDQSA